MSTSIDTDAKTIWGYMLMHHVLRKCDALLVLGSIDERVPQYAAELFNKGYSDLMIISGGKAHTDDLLATNWPEPTEAEHFAKIVHESGVPPDKFILEKEATNTGENIIFTKRLLDQRNIELKSLIVVQKPYMERRTYATFRKQWSGNLELVVTSPPIRYEDYFIDQNHKNIVLNNMVGDMQRIKEYPRLGYQIEQEIPDHVWEAWERLVECGYDKLLIKN